MLTALTTIVPRARTALTIIARLAITTTLLTTPVRAANIVANGNFEAGTLSPWVAGDGTTIDAIFPQAGLFDASLGSIASVPATLAQSVTSIANTDYQLSFFVLDEVASALNTLSISFGSFTATITGDAAFDPTTTSGYVLETFNIPAAAVTTTSTTLLFSAINDIATFNIDDVTLTNGSDQPPPPIPEPPATVLLVLGLATLGLIRRLAMRGH